MRPWDIRTSTLVAALTVLTVATTVFALPAAVPEAGAAPYPGAAPAAVPSPGVAPAADPRSGFTAGASGAGDPYFPDAGNGGYDVRHYALDLSYDPATKRLDGTAVVTAVATQNLARFDMDLRAPMAVRSLTVDGRPAAVARAGQELVITPLARPRAGEIFVVTVRYGGIPEAVIDPDGSPDGWIATDDGVYVAGEPQGSPSWFPCSDHPTDKATATVRMTVPQGITAVGNGSLVSQETRDGHTTFVWNESRPMATYLTTITLGRFDVTRSSADGIPVYVAVDPREAANSAPALARIPAILSFERSVFGPYPFETAGAIVDDARFVGYALETQTKPVFDRAPSVGTLVHELAHQWYGDSVTPRRWQDIWLNEGFATYAEWLWSEHDGGQTAQELFDADYATPADSDLWSPPTGDPRGPENIFGSPVYERGAMTLHVLRRTVGDRAFFRILRDWAQHNRYGNVSTADFVALAERDSGMDLDPLFDRWLFEDGKPAL